MKKIIILMIVGLATLNANIFIFCEETLEEVYQLFILHPKGEENYLLLNREEFLNLHAYLDQLENARSISPKIEPSKAKAEKYMVRITDLAEKTLYETSLNSDEKKNFDNTLVAYMCSPLYETE